jgi:hypothetical protein
MRDSDLLGCRSIASCPSDLLAGAKLFGLYDGVERALTPLPSSPAPCSIGLSWAPRDTEVVPVFTPGVLDGALPIAMARKR